MFRWSHGLILYFYVVYQIAGLLAVCWAMSRAER